MSTILHVINDASYWLMHREQLARAARNQGHIVIVASAEGYGQSQIKALGYECITIPIARFGFSISDILLSAYLRSLFCSGRFDIVHLMTIKPILVGGCVLAATPKGRRPKMIATVAGLGRVFNSYLPIRTLVAIALRLGVGRTAKYITFENPFDKEVYVGKKIINSERAVVLNGAGVDLEIFTPRVQKRKEERIVFLFAARLLRSKGVIEYFDAARILKDELGDKVAFQIAGLPAFDEPDGLGREEVERLSRDPAIEWLGRVDPEKMPDVLRDSDVFVLPTAYPEGIPRACIEAGACGVAVIAGSVPGTRYLLEDDRNGILLRRNDVTELAAAMKKLFQDSHFRNMLAQNLRNKILTDGFSLNSVNHKFLSLYENE